jgi:Arc/MetJ-type ribon-helix-helix transcriptional regulator
MAERNIRLPDPLRQRIEEEIKRRGYPSSSAFIRAAIENELDSRSADAIEQRMTDTLNRITRELRGLSTALQAQFALIDAIARVILHCIPEPAPEVRDQAAAQAKLRYQRLLKMATLSLQGGAQTAMAEFIRDAE